MYKLILEFKDKTLTFTIDTVQEMNKIISEYWNYENLTLRKVKTLKR